VSSSSDRVSRVIQDSVQIMLVMLIVIVAVPLAICGALADRLSPQWRARNRRAEAAWRGFTDPGQDGCSRLQNECRELVAQFASQNGLRLSEEVQEAHSWLSSDTHGWEPYLAATIRSHASGTNVCILRIGELETTVWLLYDQFRLTTPERSWHRDRWEYESPADMQRRLTEELNALVQP